MSLLFFLCQSGNPQRSCVFIVLIQYTSSLGQICFIADSKGLIVVGVNLEDSSSTCMHFYRHETEDGEYFSHLFLMSLKGAVEYFSIKTEQNKKKTYQQIF